LVDRMKRDILLLKQMVGEQQPQGANIKIEAIFTMAEEKAGKKKEEEGEEKLAKTRKAGRKGNKERRGKGKYIKQCRWDDVGPNTVIVPGDLNHNPSRLSLKGSELGY